MKVTVPRPVRSKPALPHSRPLWTIQPAPDVLALVERLAKKQAKSGHNRNHSLNRALRIGMRKVLQEEGVPA